MARISRKARPTTGLVWAYCRVSTVKAEQELSIERQVSWAKEFGRLRGSTVVIFQERASAKTILGRPQCVRLMSALSDPDSAKPEMLIATSFDRLSRDMTDTLLLARALKEAGVTLYIRDRGEIPLDSFGDQAALVGQAMGGHAENDARSQRSKASWERRRREGKPTSNKSPYGLQLRNERDVAEPTTAPWVLQAFEWYSAGVGMHSIAMRLQKSAPPHRVRTSQLDVDGNPIYRERYPVWESNRVHKMFDRIRYRGTIVPEQLYDRVQELLRKTKKWRQTRNYEYPLSGAVRCGKCNRTFHGHATGGTRKKRLANGSIATYPSHRVRYYGCIVCNYMLNADQLESDIRSHIEKVAGDQQLISAWVGARTPGIPLNIEDEIRGLKTRLDPPNLEKKRQKLWDLATGGDPYVAADLPKQLKRLSDEEAKCRDQLQELIALQNSVHYAQRTALQAKRLLRDFWKLESVADYNQKRSLWNSVIAALGGATATKGGVVWLQPG